MMITLRSHITQSLHKKKENKMTGFFCKEAKPSGDNRLKISTTKGNRVKTFYLPMIFYKLRSIRKLKLELTSSFLQRRVGENVSQYGSFNNISGDKRSRLSVRHYIYVLFIKCY